MCVARVCVCARVCVRIYVCLYVCTGTYVCMFASRPYVCIYVNIIFNHYSHDAWFVRNISLFCYDTIVHIIIDIHYFVWPCDDDRKYCLIPLLMSTSCTATADVTSARLHHWRIRSGALPNIPELVGEVRRRSTVPRGVAAASVGKQWRRCHGTEGLTGAGSSRNRRACLRGKTQTNVKTQYVYYSCEQRDGHGFAM